MEEKLPASLGEWESEFIKMNFEIATAGHALGNQWEMNKSVCQMDKCVSEKIKMGITFG